MNKTYKVNVTDTNRTKRNKDEFIEIPNAVPKIITVEQWNEVNKIRESRINPSKKRGRKVSYDDIYFQKIRCGNCGRGFKRHTTTGSGKNKKINYMCMSRVKGNSCNTRGISLNNLNRGLEEIDINYLPNTIKNNSDFKQLLDRLQFEIKHLETSRKVLMEEITELEAKKQKVLDSIIDNEDESIKQALYEMFHSVENEKKDKENQLNSLNIDSILNLKAKILDKKELIEQMKNKQYYTNEEKLKLLKKVEVTDYTLEYYFFIPNFNEEINDFNEFFPHNPIKIYDDGAKMSVTIKRNHKEAREFWENYYQEMEEY